LFIDAKLALADNYVTMRDFYKAEQYFEEALAMDSTYAPVAFFFLAQTEWEVDKFSECADHAAAYLRSNPKNVKRAKLADRLIASARFAAEAVKKPHPFSQKSLGDSINTRWMEYFPSLTAEGTLVFTRRDGGSDENLYRSEYKNGAWQTAQPLTGINTDIYNEAAQSISPDGSWLALTGCNRPDEGAQGACDLYWSQLKSTGWTSPVPFSATINSEIWESQPTIGADNKTLLFARGKDGVTPPVELWQTSRNASGKWEIPEKLPSYINVGGIVQSPFLHPDGQTLYFSSDSLPGMGGSDLFFSRKQPDGSWGPPENLGCPINTKGNEGMLVVSLDGRTAYYSSDKAGGRGSLDLYSFEMPEFARPQPITYAKAVVRDAMTGNPIIAKVEFVDLKSGKVFASSNTRSNGTFLVCLPAGKDYALTVGKDKYLFFSENFNLVDSATFEKPFTLNIYLQPVASAGGAKPVVLRNVFFESGSATLMPESKTELDRLAQLLTGNPTLNIQINGHTDNIGDDKANLTLSEARAKAVQEYLIGQAIPAERLRFKGFGETQPIDTNDTPTGRAKNRRTEFEVF
jgi:outer membrane protein OmpA-like peptidoglycan-associated protein